MDNPQILRTMPDTPGLEPDPWAEIWSTVVTLIQVSFGSFIMSMVYFTANYLYALLRRRFTCSITISG